ncbi:protein eyes shut homolog [Mercenaria mercenaria]|uniref:protein eyes shut homolog n=1 Tax=Mercenaria mercenaria TaxID=6596 RepID=UPI00234E867A|nr:protein eyes shut homolog [Mercenaria mercenaria]
MEYKIDDMLVNSVLLVHTSPKSFTLSVDVQIEQSGFQLPTYSRKLEITQFCVEECDQDKYGMSCDRSCDCNLQNTVQCDRLDGTCNCASGWQGLTCNDSVCSCISNHTESCDPETKLCLCNRHWSGNSCEVDFNECSNTSLCGNYPHTSCVSKEWGYDCLCQAGYKLENHTCVECGNTKYGLNCNQTCHCNWNHTRHCDKITGLCVCEAEWKGLTCSESACHCIANNTVKCEPESESCLCKKEWTGDRCETDIDECQNKSVCANFPHTVCVNRDWGYDCVCSAGYQSKNGRCVACQCIVENTAKCDPERNLCQCKYGWTGTGCEADINECKNTSICEGQANTACQNRMSGYDCLCRLGYEPIGSVCVEIQTLETTTLISSTNEIVIPVTLHLEFELPPTDNLEVEVTYQRYKKLSIDMLSDYYTEQLGKSFIRVLVRSISIGSLVVDHEVVTKNTTPIAEELAVAVAKMTANSEDKPLLIFDGQKVTVKDVSLNKTKVKNVCEAYMSLSPCNLTDCIQEQGKPRCRKLTPPAENSKDYTILVISLSAGIPISILIFAFVVGFCLRKDKNNDTKKIQNDNVQLRRKSYEYEHLNPGYDSTDVDRDDLDSDNHDGLSLSSTRINDRYDYLPSTRQQKLHSTSAWQTLESARQQELHSASTWQTLESARQQKQHSTSAWQLHPVYDQNGSDSSQKGKYYPDQDSYVYCGKLE